MNRPFGIGDKYIWKWYYKPINELGEEMGSDPYGAYLEAAIAAAGAASDVLMASFASGVQNLSSWEKSLGALVTEADIESDQVIAKTLKESGCGGVIISEESNVDLERGGVEPDRKIEWLVDPLCGTVPFSTGMNHWGVNIAMRADGELVVGALATPTGGIVLTSEVASGVKVNDENLCVAEPDRDLGEVAVGLEIDGQDVWRSLLGSGGLHWVTRVLQANSFASAAYPLMLVATGRMAAVVFYRIEPMHVAAGALATMLLGGRATDGNGNLIDWSRDDELPMVVVGWPRVHDQLIEAIAQSG